MAELTVDGMGAQVSAFSADLYRMLRGPGTTNLVCSPLSVMMALGMAAQGARGVTASELLTVLHAQDASAERLAAGLHAIDRGLLARAGRVDRPYDEPWTLELATANSLWGQQGLRLERAFVQGLRRHFDSRLHEVDFRRASEQARVAINAWVAERTRTRIPELIGPGQVSSMTRMVLVNALYLKAPWQTPFRPEATAPQPFHRADGSTVEVATMRSTQWLQHRAGQGWDAVRLPYADGRLAMTVVVPHRPDGLAAIETELDAAWLARVIGEPASSGQVAVRLPRWRVRCHLGLAPVLAGMGMPTAFTDDADFSGITRDEPLAISDVVHESFVAVDEAGTEAAAATALVMRAGGVPAEPVEVIADRPFLYVIHDADGVPLFVGRVDDPSVLA